LRLALRARRVDHLAHRSGRERGNVVQCCPRLGRRGGRAGAARAAESAGAGESGGRRRLPDRHPDPALAAVALHAQQRGDGADAHAPARSRAGNGDRHGARHVPLFVGRLAVAQRRGARAGRGRPRDGGMDPAGGRAGRGGHPRKRGSAATSKGVVSSPGLRGSARHQEAVDHVAQVEARFRAPKRGRNAGRRPGNWLVSSGGETLRELAPPLRRGRAMQLSRFVVAYENVRPGEHVLYSVIEDRYAGIDEATLRAIARWSAGNQPATADEREARDALVEDGFLVSNRLEDDVRVRAYLDKASEGVPGTMYVTLMPTLQCNLACNYCFQKEHPSFTKMSAPTEDATLEWLLRQVDERGLRTLQVHYFGGEPTTRKDYCLRTAQVLSASMKARGGTFRWDMTTNGIQLDVEFARKMHSFGPGAFKVTLDGDKETHDRMRVYRDGRG